MRKNIFEERIMEIFISIGIPINIKGYHFLSCAIWEVVENPSLIESVTKKLYPKVAKSFNTSASKVESAMRHAIEIAFYRGTIDEINSIFDMPVYLKNEKPTNSQFIALVSHKILLERA